MALPKVPQRTTPGFAFSMVDRALRDCLGHRQFGKAEIEQVLAFFDNDPPECVFCGSKDVGRWDHLVPIKGGGETVLGNMVPACAKCDDSKRSEPWEQWIVSDAKNSPKSLGTASVGRRIKCIKAYVRQFRYTPRKLEDRLSSGELQQLKEIRVRLVELRSEVDSLIGDYRAREETV